MKYMLYIIGIVFAVLFFHREGTDGEAVGMAGQETVLKEKSGGWQHQMEVIGKDLKSSNALTPRRNIQPTSQVPDARALKNTVKMLQDIRLKRTEQCRKVSEYVSLCQTLNLSSLLCRMGYRVYALRKIII
ncbi:MAG: hypothetical protein LBQ78_04070 [Tannerellaceae bacterium]|jgi:hypothetical protein|nr:hypothetical protein [Tannerellaceae bacterium]